VLRSLACLATVTACSDIADYEWLTGGAARALLHDVAESGRPLHATVERLRGRVSRARTHLLLEQVELRRRGEAKFTRAGRMFFTQLGLEQATDEWVAAYKAERFADGGPVADLCCGIGGDLCALAAQGRAVGVDRDPVAAHFAAANSGAEVHAADALEFDLSDVAALHIDPDRRPGGRRTTSLEFCEPDLAAMEQLLAQMPDAAAKLAPAAKVPDAWAERCELEWISRGRECRQLIAWHGLLAHSPGSRRATVLPAAVGAAPRTITGEADQPIALTNDIESYVFDIDPAVLAAGLKGALAATHGLSVLGARAGYLTGKRPAEDAALSCFAVADVLPLQLRKIAAYLHERAIGQLEIKKRGVDIDPEKLRRDLKLVGDHAATLLITRVGGRPTAILARRYSAHLPSAKIDRSS
jgi:hypothetical protein